MHQLLFFLVVENFGLSKPRLNKALQMRIIPIVPMIQYPRQSDFSLGTLTVISEMQQTLLQGNREQTGHFLRPNEVDKGTTTGNVMGLGGTIGTLERNEFGRFCRQGWFEVLQPVQIRTGGRSVGLSFVRECWAFLKSIHSRLANRVVNGQGKFRIVVKFHHLVGNSYKVHDHSWL